MSLQISNTVGSGGINQAVDVIAVKEAFNAIPTSMGAPDSELPVDGDLTPELVDAITNFQSFHQLPTVDGLINPGKATHKRLNMVLDLLAAPAPTATLASAPGGFPTTVGPESYAAADPTSLPGFAPLQPITVNCAYERRLVRVDGASINWFGVVLPSPLPVATPLGIPHIAFTPTPIQGGYSDATYEAFTGWEKLWGDYTSVLGAQLSAAAVNQVLVLPFYRTAQQQDLGSFLLNWQSVISDVVTVAVVSVDPLFLRDDYHFEQIVTSSFSNGWVAHHEFNTKAGGAGAMTHVLFDLDGQAAQSTWQPANGVIYRNQVPPGPDNPQGINWYVGGRWNQFASLYPAGTMSTHANCRNHLLYHGLKQFSV